MYPQHTQIKLVSINKQITFILEEQKTTFNISITHKKVLD